MADRLAARTVAIFRRTRDGRRPVFGSNSKFHEDPGWRDRLLFHEYFHGDDGGGQGASHQTGWTAPGQRPPGPGPLSPASGPRR